MSAPTSRPQYTLRVRPDSELHKTISAVLESPVTLDQIREKVGTGDSVWLPPKFMRWFDNLTLVTKGTGVNRTHSGRYVDLQPVIHADGVEEIPAESNGSSVAPQPAKKIIWPSAPAIPFPVAGFDKPFWFDEMEAMVEDGSHISLEGPPSVGKDTAVLQLAALKGQPLAIIGGDAGFRTKDLTGSVTMENGSTVFEVAEYAMAAIQGWWVLATEVNAADPDSLMFMNRQLAAPYVVNLNGKAYPVHPNFRLFITYNHGLVGTKPLPQSLKDRFYSIKVPFFTQQQLVKRLAAIRQGKPQEYVEYIAKFGVDMWKSYENGGMRYQITTRRLVDALRLFELLPELAPKTIITKAVIGAIDSVVDAKAAQTVLNAFVANNQSPVLSSVYVVGLDALIKGA